MGNQSKWIDHSVIPLTLAPQGCGDSGSRDVRTPSRTHSVTGNRQVSTTHTHTAAGLSVTFGQAVLPVSVKPGLAVAAKASGVVGAEGMPGALAVAAFAGFPVGTIVCEDCGIKQRSIREVKGFQHCHSQASTDITGDQ